jgi:hypothetical protein
VASSLVKAGIVELESTIWAKMSSDVEAGFVRVTHSEADVVDGVEIVDESLHHSEELSAVCCASFRAASTSKASS